MQKLKCEPEKDQQKNGIALVEEAAPAQVENPEHDGHKQRVEQHRHDCAENRRVPDPPGGEQVPDDECSISVLQDAVSMEIIPVVADVIFHKK